MWGWILMMAELCLIPGDKAFADYTNAERRRARQFLKGMPGEGSRRHEEERQRELHDKNDNMKLIHDVEFAALS